MTTLTHRCAAVLPILALAASIVSAAQGTVTATTANVRSGPGATERVVGSLPRGAAVEILEESGTWLRVKSADGKVEGWVSSRLVNRAAVAAPAAAAPAANRAGVAVTHKDAACVVAEQFVKLEACFTPADAVARAQVHFRAVDTSPWYSVDMKPGGACYSAVLPKPKSTTPQIQYFVYAIDRQFGEAYQPEGAPGRAFKPKVVKAKGECQSDMMGALPPGDTLTVNVVRDAGGKLASNAISAAGQPTELVGFSSDGLAGASAAAAAGAAGATSAGAGGGLPVVAVAGGAAAAAAVVGVVVLTGGDGEGEGEESLTGTWTGLTSANQGLSLVASFSGFSCTYGWDITWTITQSGNSVSGPASSTPRAVNCGFDFPAEAFLSAPGGSDTLTGTLSSGTITIPIPEAGFPPFTGTYTSTTINMTLNTVQEGVNLAYTLRLTKR